MHLAETEGLETLADVWSGSPADSLAGCLWRLYVIRAWVYGAPVLAAKQFDAGRQTAQVARVIAGVADPPGPDELRAMVDQVLGGIAGGDFADVLLRAAAFARVVAVGRAASSSPDAARMLTLSEQLEAAAHLELANNWAEPVGKIPRVHPDPLNSGRVPGRGSPGSQLQPPTSGLAP